MKRCKCSFDYAMKFVEDHIGGIEPKPKFICKNDIVSFYFSDNDGSERTIEFGNDGIASWSWKYKDPRKITLRGSFDMNNGGIPISLGFKC